MLVASMDGGVVYRLEADGGLVEHADLRHLVGGPVNDMLVDPIGRAYVGNFGFDCHSPASTRTPCSTRTRPTEDADRMPGA